MSIVNVNALKQNNCVLHWTGAVASANSPKQITSYGDVKQLLPFPGAGIGMFDGTGDYLSVSVANFNFGSNNFTIEGTFYSSSIASTMILFDTTRVDGVGPFVLRIESSKLKIQMASTTANATWDIANISGNTTLLSNTWYNFALIRSGTTISLKLNGIDDITPITSSLSLKSIYGNMYIGCTESNLYYFIGNISEFRISSVARYTANFTPPRRQLESDSNTKLLLHFNRNDTTFIDSSPSAHTITAYGNAKQLCSPVRSGVAVFDGSGDYVSQTHHADTNFGSSDFTVELWFNTISIGINDPSSGTWAGALIAKNQNVFEAGSWCIMFSSTSDSNIAVFCRDYNGGAPMLITTGMTNHNNGWHHVVWQRSGSTWSLYVDGILKASVTSSITITDQSQPVQFGRDSYFGRDYNGRISDVRISKGIARYTGSIFTVPTTPILPDPYTKLLLHFDGVGNAFYDSSDPPGDNGFPILPDGVTVTPNGTFAVEKMKDGRNIWKFDGSTNYITISDHASWSMFLNDFTIAGWVKFDSIAANKVIIGQYTNANNQWYLQWTTGNIIQLYGITSSTARFDFSCPLTAVANTWYHIVVQRSGSSCIMYINGVAQTVTQTTAFSATATDIAAVLSIGKINTGYQAGNVKDLQIFTKALTMDQVSALMSETYIY